MNKVSCQELKTWQPSLPCLTLLIKNTGQSNCTGDSYPYKARKNITLSEFNLTFSSFY